MRTFYIKQQTRRIDGTGAMHTKIRHDNLSLNQASEALVNTASKQVKFYEGLMKKFKTCGVDVNANVGCISLVVYGALHILLTIEEHPECVG